MSSSSAKGLFSAAISESAPWTPLPDLAVYSQAIYPGLLDATGCANGTNETAHLSCLRSAPASTFSSTNLSAALTGAAAREFSQYAMLGLGTSAMEPLLPVIGTGVIDGFAPDLIQAGSLPSAGIPLMIGNLRDEGVDLGYSRR